MLRFRLLILLMVCCCQMPGLVQKVCGQTDSTAFFSYAKNLDMAKTCYEQKKWDLAAVYTERLLADLRRLGNGGTDDYFGLLTALSSCYQLSGLPVKADSCLVLVQRHLEQSGKTDAEDYIELLIERAELQETLGNREEAEKLLLQARKRLTPSDEAYHEVALELAQQYTHAQQYEKAIAIVREELRLFETTVTATAQELNHWIVFCDNPLSKDEGKRFTALLEKMQDGSIENMAVLAYAYCHSYDYERARQVTARLERSYAQLSSEEREALLDYLQPLYTALNDFDRQVELSRLQVSAVERVVGTRHDLYAQTLELLGEIYGLKGDYYQGLQVLDSCVNIPGISRAVQIDAMEAMTAIYANMGDFAQSNHYALQLLTETDDVTMRQQLMGRIVMNLMGELEIRKYDIDEQGKADTDSLKQLLLDYADRSLSYCRQHFGEGHMNTIEATEFMAAAYYLAGDTVRMVNTAKACEQIIRKYLKNSLHQRLYLQGLSVYYQKSHDYQKALELVDTTCLQNQMAMTIEIKATLEPLAELHLDLEHYDKAQQYFNRLAQTMMNETSSHMATLTSQARQYYWRLSRNTMSGAGKYIQHTGEQDAFAGTIYNLALFSKELLLGSDQSFVQTVRNTGDETLIEKMRQMMNLRTAVVQTANMPAEERAAKAKYAEQLEKELLAACQGALNDEMEDRLPDWHDIQEALPDTAMTIEMVQYKARDEREYYGAVLLRKGWKNPVFVNIGTKAQLDMINPQDLSLETGRRVWQFLEPYQDRLRTIYFSPIGAFQRLPVECLPYTDDEVLSERFHVYRLSSTRQLVAPHTESGRDAVVYGGLDYGISVKEMEEDAAKPRQRGAGDVVTLKYLKGTEVEADSIVKLINGKAPQGMTAKLISGKTGTEASFKALSGQRKRVMHIGTHGFYAADEAMNTSSQLLRNLQQTVAAEDHALTQSGLYLAGAENKLNDEHIPDGIDDGILTAHEVSMLDFRGLELVTLSACQTAQGRVTGDGVFGLQRGFKKAGARSLLMSLWKVDDDATCLLMTEFYRNWMAGKSKHEALETARQTVRSHTEKHWDAPQYWAAFILLDGL